MEAVKSVRPILTFEEYVKIDHSYPYIYSVAFGHRTLRYFGSHHLYSPGDPLFSKLKEEIEGFDPEVVLVEGCNGLRRIKSNESRQHFLSQYGKNSEAEAIRKNGEAGYAILEAVRRGAEVFCPEPSLKEEVEELLTHGISRDALFAHYTYRTLPHWISLGKMPPFDEYFANDREMMVGTGVWSADECVLGEIERVSEKFWGSGIPFDDRETLGYRFWPSYFGSKHVPFTEVNRAAQESVYFRDRAIVSEILWALEQFKRVFIVYGCQHAVVQEPALRDMADIFGADRESARRFWFFERSPRKGIPQK